MKDLENNANPKNLSANPKERFCDIALALLLLLPICVYLILGLFCSGWNEGGADGTCTISVLIGIYNLLATLMLLMAFGGFIIYIPLVFVLYFISTFYKIFFIFKIKMAAWRRNRFGIITWILCTPIIIYISYSFIELFFFPACVSTPTGIVCR